MSRVTKTAKLENEIISESEEKHGSILRVLKNPKTYRTHDSAMRYGQVRQAAPITMINGSKLWVAMPFHGARGLIYLYEEGTIAV